MTEAVGDLLPVGAGLAPERRGRETGALWSYIDMTVYNTLGDHEKGLYREQ